MDTAIRITRETEFYQSYIRFKIAVANESPYTVNEVTLDLVYDDELLRMDRYEPEYLEKKGKFHLGSIDGDKSKSIAVYFNPQMYSKGTDINCNVAYMDYKGKRSIVQMEPQEIRVIIDEVKEKAKIACKEAQGTPAEGVACLVKKETQRWDVTDQNLMAISLDLIIDSLKSQIPDIPDNEDILDQINKIKSYTKVEYQILILSTVISQLPTISFAAKTYETVTRTENKVDLLLQTNNELKEMASKLKEEGNEKGSQDVNDIADKIKVLSDNKDPREIALFIEKLQKEVPDLFEAIEKSTASDDVKEKAKRGLKDKIMETGKNITFAVATNWIATYLPSIITAGASGLLVPGIILAVLVSIDSLRNQR